MTQKAFDPKKLAAGLQVAEENLSLQQQLAAQQKQLAEAQANTEAMVLRATQNVLAQLQQPAAPAPPEPQAEQPAPKTVVSPGGIVYVRQPQAGQPQPAPQAASVPQPPAVAKQPLWLKLGPFLLMALGPLACGFVYAMTDLVAKPYVAQAAGCLVCTPIFMAGVVWMWWRNRKKQSGAKPGGLPGRL